MAKVKNVCVNLKIENKEYNFRNLILNTLLKNYANSLIDTTVEKRLRNCCIKFSKLENISGEMELKNEDFDICILNTSELTVASTNKITNKYICDSETEFIYDYKKGTANNVKLSDYVGKKIYTLGFSYSFYSKADVLAVLDVSNYDIYIQEGEELRVTRIDEISTDAIFTSLYEKINTPIHLYPNGISELFPTQEIWNADHTAEITMGVNAYAKLTNFGFGNKPDNLDLEYDIEGNYEINGNVFSIKNIWSPKGLYPSDDLYPSDGLYPDLEPFNYLILRFKLFQKVAEDDATFEDVANDRKIVEKFTGAAYLQAIPLEKRGNVDLNIKYERG